MIIKSITKSFFVTATSVLIGITPLYAGGGEDEDMMESGSSGFTSTLPIAQKGTKVRPLEVEVVHENSFNSKNKDSPCCSHEQKEDVLEVSQYKSPCFWQSTCDTICQTMIKYIPSLPTTIAKLFLSQYPVPSEEEQDVSLKLFHLLTKGKPVDPQSLAESVHLSSSAISEILKKWPDVYYDEAQHIVGYGGLTFKPTKHKITFDDRVLYTWCAWDTLFLPAILGKTLDIESECPMDHSIVRVRAHRDGVESISPKEAVISFVMPTKGCIQQDVQTNFCRFINFFPSEEVGSQWTKLHPGTYLISIEVAFKIGRMKNEAQFGDKI